MFFPIIERNIPCMAQSVRCENVKMQCVVEASMSTLTLQKVRVFARGTPKFHKSAKKVHFLLFDSEKGTLSPQKEPYGHSADSSDRKLISLTVGNWKMKELSIASQCVRTVLSEVAVYLS